jgi:O-antigen ligase
LFVYARAHNVVLRIAAECGLVTLALLLICTLWAGHALLARRASRGAMAKPPGRPCGARLCALAAILLATSLFRHLAGKH